MPKRDHDELGRKTPTIGESYESRRPTKILALSYVWKNARDREDAILIAQALGIDHLLKPATTP